MISVLILTKNEQKDLPGCLASVSWCDDVHVFDSFSSDNTPAIATEFGAKLTQRRFDNWASHQNWGLSNIAFKYEWVLYIDADERVSPGLRSGIGELDLPGSLQSAFEIQRRDFAWNGKWLKRSQLSPYYLRLFRPQKIRYERLVNPVSVVDGPVGRLTGYLDHYPFSKGIRNWLERHVGYADLEAQMRFQNIGSGERFSLTKAAFARDFSVRRFHQKGIFYKLPFRPVIKFAYMFFGRGAFLDGRAGITYAYLQSIYEYFIVLRSRELDREARTNQEQHA